MTQQNLTQELSNIPGNENAKRALEIAIKGKHSILFIGNKEAQKLAEFARKNGLIAYAYKPCFCGYFGSSHRACTCETSQVVKQQAKISQCNTDLTVKTSRPPADRIIKIISKNNPNLTKDCLNFLKIGYVRMNLDYEDILNILKVANTIKNLSKEQNIKANHIAEALQYRNREE